VEPRLRASRLGRIVGDAAASDGAIRAGDLFVVSGANDRCEDLNIFNNTRDTAGFDEVARLERAEEDQHDPRREVAE
jgi:hypothetical protein